MQLATARQSLATLLDWWHADKSHWLEWIITALITIDIVMCLLYAAKRVGQAGVTPANFTLLDDTRVGPVEERGGSYLVPPMLVLVHIGRERAL